VLIWVQKTNFLVEEQEVRRMESLAVGAVEKLWWPP
jgi:hypothetical protein